MIRLVIVVFAFLILVGSALGGLYLWGLDPVTKLANFVGIEPAALDKSRPVRPESKATYVDYGLLIVPVVRGQQIQNQVEMILRLEVPADHSVKVVSELPRLQGAFLQEMMSVLPVQMHGGRPLDQAFVSRRLLNVANKVLSEPLVINVVLEKVAVR